MAADYTRAVRQTVRARADAVNRHIAADWSERLDECQICGHEIFSMPAPKMSPEVAHAVVSYDGRLPDEPWWFHNLSSQMDSARADSDHLPIPMFVIEEEP